MGRFGCYNYVHNSRPYIIYWVLSFYVGGIFMKKLASFLLLMVGVIILSACTVTEDQITITFDTNGGTQVNSITSDGKTRITLPEVPIKEGYLFDGWYWDNETYVEPFFATSLVDTPISTDTTVYAKWSANQFTIEYITINGEVLQIETIDFGTDLSNIQPPDDPTRSGYLFDGWSMELPDTMPASNLQILATWTALSIPQIDDPNALFLQVGDIEITNQELWDKLIQDAGPFYLNKYIEELLLSDYLDAVTQAHIDQKVEEAIYGTNDPTIVTTIQENPDYNDELIQQYRDMIGLQHLDPNNPADIRSFYELDIAKELLAKDYIRNITNEADSLFVSDSDVEAYYNDTINGDVCAVVIRFHSIQEANIILEEFNIVPQFFDRLGQYIGTTPIEDVLTSEFNETNTNIMTDEEALATYIDIYNYQHPNSLQLDNTTTISAFCSTYGSTVTYAYDDYYTTSSRYTFTYYLWNTLELIDNDETDDEIPLRFSTRPQTFSDTPFMMYKISETDVTPYDSLSQSYKDELYDNYVDEVISASVINIALDALWEDHTLEIFDPILKLQAKFNDQTEYDNDGDGSIVATFDDIDITAQQLFDYMAPGIGTVYAITMVRDESILYSDYYTEIYGNDHDYMENNSIEMVEHRLDLLEMKAVFYSNGYAAFGFSNLDYTWDEFILIALRSTSEANVIRDLFVLPNLLPNHARPLLTYDSAKEYIYIQIEEYFNLDATHILLYLDNDLDLRPDSYNSYVDGLSGQELTEYNNLVLQFESLVLSKVTTDGYTLEDIVEEYQNGLIGDPTNEWAPFKAYGFLILSENLSAGGSLSDKTTTNYDTDFVHALKRIYDNYVLLPSTEEYVDNQLTQTNFGLHLILAEKGSEFIQPSAEYDVTGSSYNSGFDNPFRVPTDEQFNLYIDYEMSQLTTGQTTIEIPPSVYYALTTYTRDLIDSACTTNGYIIATAQYMLDQGVQFTDNQTNQLVYLQTVVDSLYRMNFPKEYLTPQELLDE